MVQAIGEPDSGSKNKMAEDVGFEPTTSRVMNPASRPLHYTIEKAYRMKKAPDQGDSFQDKESPPFGWVTKAYLV